MDYLSKDDILEAFAPNDGSIKPFNYANYKTSHTGVTLADLKYLANIKKINYFLNTNYFIKVIFNSSINDITPEQFDYIKYIQSIIFDIQDITYDDSTLTTNINNNVQLIETGIQDNLNTGNNINVDSIVTTNILNNKINTKEIYCEKVIINGNMFCDLIGYVYINGLTMPLSKTTLIEEFNIKQIDNMFITIKDNYRIDIIDVDNTILYSIANTSNNWIYYNKVNYNTQMIKINIYNNLNILII